MFNGDARLNSNVNIQEPLAMETDREKHGMSSQGLDTEKTKDMKTVTSATDNVAEKVSCGGNSCNEQMTIRSNEFWNQVFRVDKARECSDSDAREVGTDDFYIKKEITSDIEMSSEENKMSCIWLEVGKCEDFDQVTVKSDDSSNTPVFDEDYEDYKVMEIEKHENDIKEENVEDVLTDIKSFSEDKKPLIVTHLGWKYQANANLHHCQLCEYKTEMEDCLEQHIKNKHGMTIEWYQCQFCQVKTKNKKNLNNHFKIVHGVNIMWHHCQHCEFKTKYKSSLKAHLQCRHNITDEECRLQQCQFCDYSSVLMIRLKQHLKRKHPKKADWLQCRWCLFKTEDEDALATHVKCKHKRSNENCKLYQCSLCKFKTHKQQLLTRHFTNVHDNITELYKCLLCDFQAEDKFRVTAHFKKNHSLDTFSLERHLNEEHDQKKLHQCQQCSYKTRNEDTLARHIMCKHESPNESRDSEHCEHYQCKLCEFKADKQSALTRHFTNVHYKNTELFKCILCDFKTEDKFRLTLHFKKNHPVSAE